MPPSEALVASRETEERMAPIAWNHPLFHIVSEQTEAARLLFTPGDHMILARIPVSRMTRYSSPLSLTSLPA